MSATTQEVENALTQGVELELTDTELEEIAEYELSKQEYERMCELDRMFEIRIIQPKA
jgi:hypothetical protein